MALIAPKFGGAPMRILVVEDEVNIARDVADALTHAGYVAEICHDGEEAWFLGETENYDALILDLGLPKLDGISVLKKLRAARVNMPVLVLTARGAWMERVEGIDAGADDYLPKPFHMEELLARVSALLRRSTEQGTPVLEVGKLRIDTRRMTVMVDAREVNLSPLEFRALRYLAHHNGRVVPQTELGEHVYEREADRDSNALEVLIGRLRRKVGMDAITTRRGFGYMVNNDAPTEQVRSP
jgi:two-component system, OmpR family, response regulator